MAKYDHIGYALFGATKKYPSPVFNDKSKSGQRILKWDIFDVADTPAQRKEVAATYAARLTAANVPYVNVTPSRNYYE